MNKEINTIKEEVNVLFKKMIKISSELLDSYYEEFTKIPTIKKHDIEIFIFKNYDSNDDGGETFDPQLYLIKTIDKSLLDIQQDKNKFGRIKNEPNFISKSFEQTPVLDFIKFDLGITEELPNEDMQKAEELLSKIYELLEYYSQESWMEDTCDKTKIPTKYNFS